MSISMIGIDHSTAPVDIRALFAFTKKSAGEVMERFKEQPGIYGCIILSTCNRLEVWVSADPESRPALYEVLCSLKGIRGDAYEKYFVAREDREATEHLFYLTSGLKSQIVGEDQILTQVKEALGLAREHYATDSVLEVLFRMAVTAGKRIKTEVPFSHGDPSAIHQAIRLLKNQGYEMEGKTCMVIGNGEMGKLAAQTLKEAGAHVTVTVRQYRSGMISIPAGCDRINYGERMEYLPECDLVVSATASPNLTLKREAVEELQLTRPLTLVDLAVPRDIDPGIRELDGISLYDMDSLGTAPPSAEFRENLEAVGEIVNSQMEEFYQWLEGRDLIPRIQGIREAAVNDLNLRIGKQFKNAPMGEEAQRELLEAVDQAAGKVVNKLIFGLRDHLTQEAFLDCIAGLEKVYLRE